MLFHHENAHTFSPFGNHLIWQEQKLFERFRFRFFSFSVLSQFLCLSRILCKNKFCINRKLFFLVQTICKQANKKETNHRTLNRWQRNSCVVAQQTIKKDKQECSGILGLMRDMHSLSSDKSVSERLSIGCKTGKFLSSFHRVRGSE